LLLQYESCCGIILARERGDKETAEEIAMELRTASPRRHAQSRLSNHCAQCGETIFLPEWSEYLARHRVRHLWECEACGYKFETLVSFAESDASLVP
jgi:ribosomal protein S14